MTTLLAFDTATEHTALALTTPAGAWHRDLPGGPQASATLLPELLALLAQAGVSLGDVDAIGFGRGPGAFTGLRTACSVAQGLAFGVDKPVLALDSLAIVAEDARTQRDAGDGFALWVAMDARMDEVYAARYRRVDGRWVADEAPRLCGVDAFNAAWADAPAACIAGSALDAMGDRLVTPQADRVPRTASRARALGALAHAAWLAGDTLDAALALPLYLRDKVAQTTVEREAARAAKAAAA